VHQPDLYATDRLPLVGAHYSTGDGSVLSACRTERPQETKQRQPKNCGQSRRGGAYRTRHGVRRAWWNCGSR
jgi:hypothetical protein